MSIRKSHSKPIAIKPLDRGHGFESWLALLGFGINMQNLMIKPVR